MIHFHCIDFNFYTIFYPEILYVPFVFFKFWLKIHIYKKNKNELYTEILLIPIL